MEFTLIAAEDPLWEETQEYAANCSWRAGKSLAFLMQQNAFEDWERVIVALEQRQICGFCTVAKTDCIPDLHYMPYIGYLFVGEEHRGARLSEKLIGCALQYLKTLGFAKAFLVSDHVDLYEKYGFCIIDRKMAPWGTEEKIYMKTIP